MNKDPKPEAPPPIAKSVAERLASFRQLVQTRREKDETFAETVKKKHDDLTQKDPNVYPLF